MLAPWYVSREPTGIRRAEADERWRWLTMRGLTWILCACGALAWLPTAPARGGERPIVAVFQIEDRSGQLDAATLDQLTDYLGSLMARKGYQVVPRSQLKERLLEAKKGSYRACYDESCQIEVGKELAAQKSLASQVLKLGSRCTVTLNLFDLKRSASEGAGTASDSCEVDKVVDSLKLAVDDLLGGGTVPGPTAAGKEPGAGGGLEWVMSRPAGVEFAKSEVTVAQYKACVEAGKCSAPKTGGDCNWDQAGRDAHPINCVDWDQATAFCGWAGGRLPTEREWYAEASESGKRKFAWGDELVSCERAIWKQGGSGCGKNSTWPVCSKAAGHSVSGLCDLAGNVWEWTSSSEGRSRVVLGGSWDNDIPVMLRASARRLSAPANRYGSYGFRCGRSAKP
jgi:hypothetical protein